MKDTNTLYKQKMKYSTFFTAATVSASHYRGGTYQFAPGQKGMMTITQTQTWRDSFGGYSREFFIILKSLVLFVLLFLVINY